MQYALGMRHKILIFSLLISILPILVLSYLASSHARQTTEEMVTDHLVSIADMKKKELEAWVVKMVSSIGGYANHFEIKNLLIGKDSVQQQRILSHILEETSCRRVLITGRNSEIIASTNPADIGTIFPAPSLKQKERINQLYIHGFSINQAGASVMQFEYPVLHNSFSGKNFDGSLIYEIDLNSQVFHSISNWPGMGATGEILVSKKEGEEIVFLNTLRHRKTDASQLRIPVNSEHALPAIFASTGNEGIIRTADYRGQQVLAVYKHIPSLNWGVVAKIDQNEAFAPISILQKKIIIFTVAIVLVILVISVFISNSIINPLKKIEKFSRKIAKGDLSEKLDISSGGEIGTLAQSLEKMQEDLGQYQRDLLLSEKLAAIGKLSGSVAHDIRNPLGAISNSVYFLNHVIGEKIQDDKIKKHINIMEREINRADDIISDLMDFSRENIPDLLPNDMNALIGMLIEEMSIPQNITVIKNLSPTIHPFYFDRSQIRRVLYNIILNAIHAMQDSGSLYITTEGNSENVVITIRDTGSGISLENQEIIYEPLFTTKSKGVGLGLSISKTFVEKHQGHLTVSSRLGQGSSFMVELPAVQEKMV